MVHHDLSGLKNAHQKNRFLKEPVIFCGNFPRATPAASASTWNNQNPKPLYMEISGSESHKIWGNLKNNHLQFVS